MCQFSESTFSCNCSAYAVVFNDLGTHIVVEFIKSRRGLHCSIPTISGVGHWGVAAEFTRTYVVYVFPAAPRVISRATQVSPTFCAARPVSSNS
jgi:hypothetical protein